MNDDHMDSPYQASQLARLKSQLRGAYIKVTYTHASHYKLSNTLVTKHHITRTIQVIFAALTPKAILIGVFLYEDIASLIAAFLSTVALLLNTYLEEAALIEKSQQHKEAATELWKIREEYVSAFIDAEALGIEAVTAKRDELQIRTASLYGTAPSIGAYSYKEAMRMLNRTGKQSIFKNDMDIMDIDGNEEDLT
ncbi:MAG: SLATT domain-containing protein [Defluviitaleaceae bacterium]|nr:SLATT domain-containing protein [Defluviitaleaceae bacterium]